MKRRPLFRKNKYRYENEDGLIFGVIIWEAVQW